MILRRMKKENAIINITINTKKGASNMNENTAIVTINIELKICFTFVFIAFIYGS